MNEFPTGSEDDRVRRLLNDAVADVEPRDSLDSIRSRTAATPLFRSSRPWFLGAAAAAVATAATVTAVALTGDSTGPAGDPNGQFAGSPSATVERSPSPSQKPDPSQSASPDQRVAMTVPVYFVGETSRGPRLFREFRSVNVAEDERAAAAASLALGPATDPDYRSGWPDGLEAASAFYDGDVITVDVATPSEMDPETVRQRPDGMSEEQARLAVEQLIYTVQAALQQGRPGVQFLLNGERTDMLLGVPTSEPLAEGDSADVLAQVWIIEPAEGAEVASPFTVSGLAAAFEANVQWELMQGEKVVKRGFTTAQECCTMSPYSFKVNAPPGEYTLVVHDTDPSGGEGFAPWEDTKTITVR